MSAANQYVDKIVSGLRSQIDKLEGLKGIEGEGAQVLTDIRRVWGEADPAWLLAPHVELDSQAPIDLLRRREVQPVRELLGRLGYGSAV